MRLGINVPNELIKQVKAIDPEVNVSHICREALKSYVAGAGRVTERVASDGMEEHIMRLSQSDRRPLIDPDWVGYALDDARDWVRTANPDEWDRLFFFYDLSKDRGEGFDSLMWLVNGHFHPGVKGLHDREQENKEWFDYQCDVVDSLDDIHKGQEEYIRTWFAYVNEVRRMRLQHQEEEHERLMVERRKAWQARPEPELPPQLRG